MRRSDPFDHCACGEPLPARYGKGGRPKKCEGCKQTDRARREREARARRRVADKDLASQAHAAVLEFPKAGRLA